jgi:hypothetical protein
MVRSELDLSSRRATSHQRVDNHWAEMTRDFAGLVEASFIFAPPMERNWDDAIDILK